MIEQANSAYRALIAGNPSLAIENYSVAIESRALPADVLANALLNRALAYQKTEQYQEAIDDYAAALRIDALSAKLRATALYNRGLAYQKTDRQALAIEDFTSALFLDSEFSHCYYSRGIALRESGQFLFALSDFEKARRYSYPLPHLVYFGEALVYEQLKRPDEAVKSLQKALALKPDFQPARQHLTGLGFSTPVTTDGADDVDRLTTGSISAVAAGQVVTKDVVPPAVKPPAEFLPTAASQPAIATPPASQVRIAKKYTDRIPQEDTPASQVLVSRTVALDEDEKLLTVEEVPPPKTVAIPAAAPPPSSQSASAGQGEQPEKANATSAQPAGWSVQLSSAKEEKLAWGIWQKLKAKHKILEDKQAVVVRADLGQKGTFYRLRLAGYEDQKSAASLCNKLKSRGLSCYVSRIDS
jgi:Tfp pilus assembly protein PilF